jgi:hypothetical protein
MLTARTLASLVRPVSLSLALLLALPTGAQQPGRRFPVSPAPPPTLPLAGAGACLSAIRDEATGGCLGASSAAALGRLYPLSSKLFVAEATGRVGLGTLAPRAGLHVESDAGVLATGTFGSGSIPTEGSGVRMMWYPARAAFRVGRDENGEWNDGNIGVASFAAGSDTKASGACSTIAGGLANIAQGAYSGVGGGFNNGGLVAYAHVGGGSYNFVSGAHGVIAGGYYNSVTAPHGSVAGGFRNTASGSRATVAGGSENTALGAYGFAAGRRAKANHKGSFVWGDSAEVDKASAAADEFNVYAEGGMRVFAAGTAAPSVRVDASGNVGIGTASPGFLLEVNGSAGKPGGGAWSVASDRRLKRDIAPLEGALATLLALRGVSFEYRDPAAIHELPGRRIGFVAQEVEAVLPDWVDEAPDGTKRLTTRGFEALAVEALRALAAENRALRERNAALDRRLTALEERLATPSGR